MANKILALLLSIFVIGLGQIYLGKGARGIKLILISYFGLPLYLLTALNLNFYLFVSSLTLTLFVIPLLWIYNIIDVLRINQK